MRISAIWARCPVCYEDWDVESTAPLLRRGMIWSYAVEGHEEAIANLAAIEDKERAAGDAAEVDGRHS